MSYAPDRLTAVGRYLDAMPAYSFLGIVGDPATHFYGYHLGADRLPSGDYSNYYPRDRAGLTNAASALDIGAATQTDLIRLCAWMVSEARAGRRPDTREIIGPRADGRACRWAVENGWREELRSEGDGHEWHIHESYFRDSEYRDKIQYFRPYFEDDMNELEFKNMRIGSRRMEDLLITLDARTNYLSNVLNLAGRFDGVVSKLEAVLVAANDDGQLNVTMDETSKAALAEGKALLVEIRDAVAAVPDSVVDELHSRTAE